jgi:nitrate ABC transporter ATP-binding subunit
MNAPLEITGLTKVFSTPAGPFVAVEKFEASIEKGEFVCLLGHSGCGKSTVLSLIAGLEKASSGSIYVEGKAVNSPGTDRGVVFQAPCLLPWLSAEENVILAVGQVFPQYGRKRQREHAQRYLQMVGVEEFVHQTPGELSLGIQQRVSLARALALEPRFLLLDEPFGMLDSLTRFELQDTLLKVWDQTHKTVLMVTHDVDEALYLSDRLLLMTDGPGGRVGRVMSLPFARSRERASVLEHHQYYPLRESIFNFLEDHAAQSSIGRVSQEARRAAGRELLV